jgi:hypothetical protein
MEPFWMAVLFDYTADEYDAGAEHWQRLTGWTLSDPTGDHGEFQGLRPPDGHSYLAVQRLDDGPARTHLDLHVTDPPAAAAAAIDAGARMIIDNPECEVLASPGGLVFCYLGDPGSRTPSATVWPGGQRSRVDQLCIDVPLRHWATESEFWTSITGWPLRPTSFDEFTSLVTPAEFPMRILLQRLGEDDGPVRAHVDWSASDRDEETARHLQAGSEVVKPTRVWTVMNGPGGIYCIVDD